MARKRAGCVPARRTASGSWEVLLVQSRWKPTVWVFPKGGVEADEKAKQAATRETLEEGGVAGRLGPKLGVWGGGGDGGDGGSGLKIWLLFVDVEYSPDSKMWKERRKRRRAWHSLEGARAVFRGAPEADRRPMLEDMLDRACEALDRVTVDADGDVKGCK